MSEQPNRAFSKATSAVTVIVTLTCGHSWREHRPASMAAPVQGELRACSSSDHYPNQYRASYSMESAPEPNGAR